MNRENKQLEEFFRQKKILEAQAKAKASQKPKMPSCIADLYLRSQSYQLPLPPKETTDSPEEMTARRQVTSLLYQSHHRLLPYSDEAPDLNPGGKKIHPMLRHRINPYPDAKRKTRRVKASSSVPTSATEAQPSTSATNEEAATVQPSAPAPMLKSVAIQTMEAQVEAARVQPSTNDEISEVTNTQVPVSVSNNAIVEATNATFASNAQGFIYRIWSAYVPNVRGCIYGIRSAYVPNVCGCIYGVSGKRSTFTFNVHGSSPSTYSK